MNTPSPHDQVPAGVSRDFPGSTEGELVAELRNGNDAAFEWLVRTFGGRLLVVARRMLGDDAEGADAVQDAFLSAFQRLETFRGDSQLATWLHRILVNVCLMRLRARKRRSVTRIDDLLPDFDDTGHHTVAVGHWPSSPHELLARAETRAQVRQCIAQLPDGYREIVLLRDIEGLETAEAAELLGVSEAVVKTRLHRARQALRTLLEPHFAEREE